MKRPGVVAGLVVLAPIVLSLPVEGLKSSQPSVASYRDSRRVDTQNEFASVGARRR